MIVASERDSRVLIRTEEPKPRDIDVSTREFDGLRLAYAQHVYKAQGLTTDRALVLTGGWQTDRETSYVALTRAREQTDIYTSREDLGHQGIDTRRDQQTRPTRQQEQRPAGEHQPRQTPNPTARAKPLRQRATRSTGPRRPTPTANRDETSAAGSFAEQLRRIQQEQREHDREHDNGFEM